MRIYTFLYFDYINIITKAYWLRNLIMQSFQPLFWWVVYIWMSWLNSIAKIWLLPPKNAKPCLSLKKDFKQGTGLKKRMKMVTL